MVGWGVALALAQKVGGIAVTLVLIRLISPEAFGQYGLVNALLMFAFTLSMQRFMEHSFHCKDEGTGGYGQHLGFGIILHLALFAALNLALVLAPLPANYSEVRTFIHVGSLSLLLNVPRIYYSTHLRRVLDWRRQRSIHLTSIALSAAGSIGLAAFGFGVTALLAQNLLVPIPYVIDLVRQRPDLLRVTFDLSEYGSVLRFGSVRSLSSVVGVGQQLAEASLITAVAGFASFGIYGRANGLSALAAAWLGDQLQSLMYPIVARVDPGGYQARRVAGLVLRLAMWTSAPVAASFFVFNDTVVSVLYGVGWMEVAPLLQPALVVSVLTMTLRGLMLVLLTTQGPGPSLVAEIAQLLLCLVGLVWVLSSGVLAYIWFIATGCAVLVLATLLYLVVARALTLTDVAAGMAPVAILALVAGVVAGMEDVRALDARHSLLALGGAMAVSAIVSLLVVRLVDYRGMATACLYMPGGASIAAVLRLTPDPSLKSNSE